MISKKAIGPVVASALLLVVAVVAVVGFCFELFLGGTLGVHCGVYDYCGIWLFFC